MPLRMKTTLVLLGLSSVLASSSAAEVLVSDNFNDYAKGPLSSSGKWVAGAGHTSDKLIMIEKGSVKFAYKRGTPLALDIARNMFPGKKAVSTGMVYAQFDFKMEAVPVETYYFPGRPGFISFGNRDGSAQRAYVGMRPGKASGTYNLGLSHKSAQLANYEFDSAALKAGKTYRVVVGLNVENGQAFLWVDQGVDESPRITSPVAEAIAIRRVNLVLDRSGRVGNGSAVYYIDNLTVTTNPSATANGSEN